MYRGSVLFIALLSALLVSVALGDEAAIRKQIERMRATEVNAWRKIPWTESLLAARRTSEREKRPIFLFTYDGNLSTGRC
jgi:hypothetical protein